MRALTLEYHDVVTGADFDASGFPGRGPGSYKLRRADFESHLVAIKRRAPVPPTRATDWLEMGRPGYPLFLTFDDGGISAYTCIADALEQHGWRGHFFVTTGRIGSGTFVTNSQLRELHARGHIVGAHSHTHPARMGACSPERIADEWLLSTRCLADTLGEPVLTASVPGGYFTTPVAEAAARAGLKVLFTSTPSTVGHTVDGCCILGRYTLRQWSSAARAGSLAAGAYIPRASQWAIYGGISMLRRVLGERYTQIRQMYWTRRA